MNDDDKKQPIDETDAAAEEKTEAAPPPTEQTEASTAAETSAKQTDSIDWDKIRGQMTDIAGKVRERSQVIIERAGEYTKQGAKVVKEHAEHMADKAADLTKIGKYKFEIAALNRRIEDEFTKLGEFVYTQITSENEVDLKANETIIQVVETVNHYKAEIEDYQTRIQKLREVEAESPAPDNAEAEIDESPSAS